MLGIDPGLATLGYGIIETNNQEKQSDVSCVTYGIISTPKDTLMGERLAHIQKELTHILKLYEPDEVSVETIFFFRNQKTIIQIGQVHGVLSLTLFKAKMLTFRYPPLKIKNMLTGNGRAEKKELEKAVKKILRIRKPIKPDDAADALAVALCHLFEKNNRLVPKGNKFGPGGKTKKPSYKKEGAKAAKKKK